MHLCQNFPMDRTAVIAKLREHAPELQAAGLMHVRVFGSTARAESNDASDVDLLVDFDPARRQTLVTVGSLQSRLSELLNARVDLSATEWMREPVRTRAVAEAILAF
jgi:predicted nucleotidyltransferase